MHSGTHTEISKLDLKIQPISHTVIEPTETITPATTTPQKWPPHESPTVAGTRELPAAMLGFFFGADQSGIGRGGNRLTRSCSQLQHHVEPDAGCQDSRRLSPSPPHQEARHCSQVRRLRHQAPRCKLVCDFERCVRGEGWFWKMRVTNVRPNDEPIPNLRRCRHREASLNETERTRPTTRSSTIPRADALRFMSRTLEQHNGFGTWGSTRCMSHGVLTFGVSTGPCPPPPRVRPALQAQEDRPACVRWLEVRQLRPRPRRPCFPHRGAEDRQEGAEGAEPG